MTDIEINNERKMHYEEIYPKPKNGMLVLILNIALMIASGLGFVLAVSNGIMFLGFVAAFYFFLVGPILFAGLKILKPN